MNSPRALERTTRFDVPFHHCDPLNVVWHGRYLEYFEVARQKLLEQLAARQLPIIDFDVLLLPDYWRSATLIAPISESM